MCPADCIATLVGKKGTTTATSRCARHSLPNSTANALRLSASEAVKLSMGHDAPEVLDRVRIECDLLGWVELLNDDC